MAIEVDTEWLTIPEAADLLKISTVTLHRWLKQGRLPAYHVGPRYVRIRRQDLASVFTPVSKATTEDESRAARVVHDQNTVKPLTEEEVRRRLKAIEQCEALTERMRARRGGKALPSSWRLIRQAREERSRHL